jgi:hypothetical protein
MRQLLVTGLRLVQSAFAPGEPETVTAMYDQAIDLYDQGDYAAAQDLYEQVLELKTRVLGPEHPGTLRTMGDLASTLGDLGDLAGARDLGIH